MASFHWVSDDSNSYLDDLPDSSYPAAHAAMPENTHQENTFLIRSNGS